MQATAETLEAALDEQPDGVFTGFKAIDHLAGRPAVTYTEVRSAVSVCALVRSPMVVPLATFEYTGAGASVEAVGSAGAVVAPAGGVGVAATV